MNDAVDPDSLARQAASDPRRSVLLQAPAGSGKTTVLTERLLRLLADVNEPEEILAITFTRKAAAEMRVRVLRALRGEIDGSSVQGARMLQFAAAALARSAQRGWNLGNDPGRLRIQTIDSFNFRLASQLTVAAGAGAGLVVTERADQLYAEAARGTLAAADDDPELAAHVGLLFERLDNNWGNVQRLLAGMLARRGHWLRYVLGHEPRDLCARISRSLADIVRDHLEALRASLPATLLSHVQGLPAVGALTSEPAALVPWQRLACLVLTKEFEWRKPGGINRRLGVEFEVPGVREALKSAIAELSGLPGMREALEEVLCLPPVALGAADVAAIEALSRVLRSAAIRLHSEFALAGRVDHTFVAGAARAALTEAGEPTDLALRTGLSLRHILVDEFQDTSLAQFELIRNLTVGWEEADGRTLFVVGDPMQSIYQFREAEVGLFLSARDVGIGSVRLQPLQLRRNFRSVPGLIDWINNSFGPLFPARDDLRASAVSFTASSAARAREAADAVSLRLFSDRTREMAAVAARIAALKMQAPAATIAVLVASRSSATPLMLELESRRVDVVGVELVPLGELSIVRDLTALMHALTHLGDRTAWLGVLRAPWCGVTLASLTALSQRRDPQLVWDAIGDEARLAACSADDRGRLARLRAVLASALLTRNSLPLADWLERTWIQLGGPDAYPVEDLRHARAFLAVLSERVTSGEGSRTPDLTALADSLFAQPQAATANPVQVMTIHRAKGLEFDHVFVPALDRSGNRDAEPLLRWLDLPRAGPQSDLIMAPVPAIGAGSGGEISAYIKRLTARRAANEQIRLMYVAATRARQSLELSAAPKPKRDGTGLPRSGTLLACIWPAVSAMGSLDASVEDGTANAMQPLAMRRLTSRWQPAPLPTITGLPRLPVSRAATEVPEFSWVGETAREIGTVVHAALEKFSQSGLPEADSIEARREFFVSQLRRSSVPESELTNAASTVINALKRTARSRTGRWIFSDQHVEVRSEWALTGVAAGQLAYVVIDRSFVDTAGTRWVIDFKTSAHQGGGLDIFLDQQIERYRPQLTRYRELARAMGPQTVRAGLYFPLLDAFREIP